MDRMQMLTKESQGTKGIRDEGTRKTERAWRDSLSIKTHALHAADPSSTRKTAP